jgi:2-phosphosulfolactate phosphatase
MPGLIRTHLLPQFADPAEPPLAGGVAVIIDQLRASTTICAALAAGAKGVYPFFQPEEAVQARDARPPAERASILLGGERDGLLIPGFDLDNSPLAYTAQRVSGRGIYFTTTNGTKAVQAARQSDRIVMGCLANLSALAELIASGEGPVHLICAGTRDRITLEDVLAAGAIAERLVQRGWSPSLADPRPDDDSTLLAIAVWRDVQKQDGGVLKALIGSRGGRNLCRVGLEKDVIFCAQIDAVPLVPWLSPDGVFVIAPNQP